MDSADLEGSDSVEQPAEPSPTPTPPSPHGDGAAQIPPPGSGERLAFLVGMQPSLRPSPSSSKGGRARGGLPPTGNGRKWSQTPGASSSDGGGPVQKKGKTMDAGDKRAQRAKSPIGTSSSSRAPSESVNEISDDEDEVVEVNAAAGARATRRLTSDVWLEMKKEFVGGEWRGICNYCHKSLSAKSRSGTSHLRDHLKVCTLRQLKLKSKTGKSLSQSSLRMTAQADGKVNVETYTFDQDTAREELGNMIVLHDYPLSIVDHASESAFSMSGRIVTDHRSRLTSKCLRY